MSVFVYDELKSPNRNKHGMDEMLRTLAQSLITFSIGKEVHGPSMMELIGY